ncbi:MAG: hypothetical protein K0V04_12170, partial [Deltaproteobacteria bacterium]|nr:hypothetical protein [Deltaproteobacteria bacterium]
MLKSAPWRAQGRAILSTAAHGSHGARRDASGLHARTLARFVARKWSDARICKALQAIGARAEAGASRPWGMFARSRRDSARTDARADDGKALVGRWARKAAKDIKSVRASVAKTLAKDVVQALEAGTSAEELAGRWRKRGVPSEFGTLEGRTKVIAQH